MKTVMKDYTKRKESRYVVWDSTLTGNRMRGNCYISCEALYHLLGGRDAGYKPMNMRHEGGSHWFLLHHSGLILDPTVSQFIKKPNYAKAKGKGFLTKFPSKRARALMRSMVYSV